MKTYKFIFSEILREFFCYVIIGRYCVFVLSLYGVYRLYDKENTEL